MSSPAYDCFLKTYKISKASKKSSLSLEEGGRGLPSCPVGGSKTQLFWGAEGHSPQRILRSTLTPAVPGHRPGDPKAKLDPVRHQLRISDDVGSLQEGEVVSCLNICHHHIKRIKQNALVIVSKRREAFHSIYRPLIIKEEPQGGGDG